MKKILIIDDEDYITEIISMFSNELGYSADASNDGSDAIERIKSNDYWAVFCDLMMPGLNGLEIFERVEQINTDLCRRFILITGAILDKKIEEKVYDKNVVVFRKPFNFENIREVFSKLEMLT
jgi:two-component system, NtrC family, sensor kinase